MQVKEDMIAHFKGDMIQLNDHISFIMVDALGREERGRGKGVDRDVYSAFWTEVYLSLFVGELERVPFIRHDLFTAEWVAIGKIIYKGYKDVGYFPILICKSFLSFILFGENEEEDLMKSFLNYVSNDEKTLLNEALITQDESFFQCDEMLDFLDQFKCRSLVNSTNVRTIILELARQELVQKPHIMAVCWKESFFALQQFDAFKTKVGIDALYNQLDPSVKKVLKLFEPETKDDADRDCLSHLKRFVKGLDQPSLKRFLRFVTGSDLVIVDHIKISFIKQGDFERRPIAHTCGPVLEISPTYSNFVELRKEFSDVLQSSYLSMDII
ncbi:uncharacterized protein [Clytia hemisphaerica]|uniref:uncharacterized protein n=1 Tax=Clytia hemisphaerica TaxID=252671 RepID=UPI0034D4CE3C